MQPIPETLPLRQGPIIFGYRQVGKERVPAMHLEREALGSDEVSALSTLLGLQPARRMRILPSNKLCFFWKTATCTPTASFLPMSGISAT